MNCCRLITVCLCATLLAGGCTTTKIPLVPLSVPLPRIPFLGGDELNLARRDRDEACQRLIKQLRQDFPHTERKGINWDALEANLLAALEASDSDSDYYYALRDFAAALNDANISLSESPELLAERFAGGYGLSLAQLDDGRILVTQLVEDGPAEQAGIEVMAELLRWNDLPITDAVLAAPVLWGGQPAATQARAFTRKLSGITRAPLGTEATLVFRNPGSAEPDNAQLTAIEEIWGPLQAAEGWRPSKSLDTDPILEAKTLDQGIGYIRVALFAPNMSTPFPGRAFRSAIQGYASNHAPGLIIDLRGTSSGLDEFGAEFLSYFLDEPTPYRNLALYDEDTNTFEIDPSTSLKAKPSTPRAPENTILLVDGQTARAAEAFAWTLQHRGLAKVAGETNTRGVTLVPDRTATLPDGHTFTFPIARWLAPDGSTPLEPDAAGNGGLTPDLKIPVTEDSLRRSLLDGEDVALNFVVGHLLELTKAAETTEADAAASAAP